MISDKRSDFRLRRIYERWFLTLKHDWREVHLDGIPLMTVEADGSAKQIAGDLVIAVAEKLEEALTRMVQLGLLREGQTISYHENHPRVVISDGRAQFRDWPRR